MIAGGGGGGGGGGYRHTDQNNGSLSFYFIVQIPPIIDWTYAGEECRATAEITQSLQIDLVLSDAAATSEPLPVELMFSHFAYGQWLADVAKMHTAPKNAIFRQNFTMSATPVKYIDIDIYYIDVGL